MKGLPAAVRGPAEVVNLCVTSRCNARCSHCFYAQQDEGVLDGGGATEIGLEQVETLCSNLGGVRHLTLMGGEPLLAADLFGILWWCTEGGIDAQLVTNGIALGQNLSRLLDSGIANVHVSLDAAAPEDLARIKGVAARTYWQVCRSVATLAAESKRVRRPFSVGASFLIHRDNIGSIGDFIDRGVELGVDYVHLSHYHAMGPRNTGERSLSNHREVAREAIDRVMRRADYPCCIVVPARYHDQDFGWRYCRSLFEAWNVNHRGDLAPCSKKAHHPGFGNALEDPDQLGTNEATRRFRRAFVKEFPLPECTDCSGRFRHRFAFIPEEKRWRRVSKY